jgi:Putative transposase/Transposase zinc-binding domain
MNLADVVRRHGPAYLGKYGERMPKSHRRALDAIMRCHTPAQGGSLYACDHCGTRRFAYHRCGHRACNQCGHAQSQQWLSAQTARLLPVGYFLVAFTIPQPLRAIFRAHQRLCYDLLFVESAAALQDVARQPRYLGGDLAMLGVLHTWSRQLSYHPHVHYLVPGVALRADGTLCFPADPEYLLPVQRLSARFRSRMRASLRQVAPDLYARIPQRTWREPWIVHSQFAGRGAQALSYLARYVSKTALSSNRLLHQDNRNVTFSYRESKTNSERTLTLGGEAFLHRFLQHVLPKGFRRVRTSGWLSPAARRRFQTVRILLHAPDHLPSQRTTLAIPVCCPHCQHPMRRIADFRRTRGPPELRLVA